MTPDSGRGHLIAPVERGWRRRGTILSEHCTRRSNSLQPESWKLPDIDSIDQFRQPPASEKDAATPRGRCPPVTGDAPERQTGEVSLRGSPRWRFSVHAIMILETLEIFWPAFLGLLLYSATGYGKNKTDHGEGLDPIRFLATFIVYLLVGGMAIATGDPLSEQELHSQVAAYAGAIAVFQNFLEIIIPVEWKRTLRERVNQ